MQVENYFERLHVNYFIPFTFKVAIFNDNGLQLAVDDSNKNTVRLAVLDWLFSPDGLNHPKEDEAFIVTRCLEEVLLFMSAHYPITVKCFGFKVEKGQIIKNSD